MFKTKTVIAQYVHNKIVQTNLTELDIKTTNKILNLKQEIKETLDYIIINEK